MSVLLSLFLTAALLFNIALFKGCSQQQREATCQDIVTTLKDSESAIVNAFPGVRHAYIDQLEPWSKDICDSIKNAQFIHAKDVIAAFLPVFDTIIAQLGADKAKLALVDIAIHIVLNHLPVAAENGAVIALSPVLQEYRSRPVWGCQFKPNKCMGELQ